MTIHTALITGIGGQDGAYLAQLLIRKGYQVAGFDRPGQGLQIPPGAPDIRGKVRLFDADVTNPAAVRALMDEIAPTELYHLASFSHVGQSFESERDVEAVNVGGTETVLSVIAEMPEPTRPRIYNACSSEVFGAAEGSICEDTAFNPQSPYARSKAAAYKRGCAARSAHGLHLSQGLMFNHESPLRAETFVTRKLTKAAARAGIGRNEPLPLGNVNAARDWGHAADYVDAMWRMLQMPEPDDFVIASGVARTVRDLAETAYAKAGIELVWEGESEATRARDAATGATLIHMDPEYLRPVDFDAASGNTAKARTKLGWRPQVSFEDMVAEMVATDFERLETKVAAQA